ncbi:MAG: tyrosine-type recombinase/integrase [Clostridiales bacterium]|nr:tyrosine-type recombinase/integrase [Clostridiales bacterium]
MGNARSSRCRRRSSQNSWKTRFLTGIPRRSPHKIRKTYCSILFDSGMDQKLITDQMGHTDIMCSELHYHRNRKDLDDKIKKISAIPEFRQKLALV